MAELEELEQEELDEKLLDVNPISDSLPSVPASEPQKTKKGKLQCENFCPLLPTQMFGVFASNTHGSGIGYIGSYCTSYLSWQQEKVKALCFEH